MSVTGLAEVNAQIQKFWSPVFEQQLKENTLLPSLVSKKYQGEIKKGGDTVRVSQINRPEAEIRDIGTNASTFNTQQLSTQYVDIQANKRIVTAYEFEDLVELQSQIMSDSPAIRQAMFEACEIKLNSYLYSLCAASISSPDHSISGVTDLNATQLNAIRQLASTAKWAKDGGWWLLADPSYYSDLLAAQTLTSSDYGASDAPVIGGQIVKQRFGFNLLEDNSAGLIKFGNTLGSAAADYALAFHPDFLHLVMGAPTFMVSPLHSNKQFGFVISCDFWAGAKLGNDGAKKHIQIYNS